MQYKWLDEYLLSKVGATKDFKEEWQWHRYLIGGKMFGAICKNKVGEPIVTVKCDPLFGESLRNQYADVNEGYYMNKVHWNSVNLESDVPETVIKLMVDQSYQLVFNALSKKMQREIAAE
ncbi:putative DNA-binding protein (MmcQ/YjbR family) [Natranaerovirga hydrolytica]|uniref:Putative DNA-binding protein (MmcQ/YjbR family) n=1 Tax=Natranaerovirga hydrolytica TaxID=680378 RepID=A0A4R1MYX6_9FIRM|nr:MmcQ/YjbR family DNA-binding protein [Natranaerovirga hydrolytica]TCK98517.1 putative DNA-binding protein (MmcQ/YjbR family) [Natranaerovirga hydrolytica]